MTSGGSAGFQRFNAACEKLSYFEESGRSRSRRNKKPRYSDQRDLLHGDREELVSLLRKLLQRLSKDPARVTRSAFRRGVSDRHFARRLNRQADFNGLPETSFISIDPEREGPRRDHAGSEARELLYRKVAVVPNCPLRCYR